MLILSRMIFWICVICVIVGKVGVVMCRVWINVLLELVCVVVGDLMVVVMSKNREIV